MTGTLRMWAYVVAIVLLVALIVWTVTPVLVLWALNSFR